MKQLIILSICMLSSLHGMEPTFIKDDIKQGKIAESLKIKEHELKEALENADFDEIKIILETIKDPRSRSVNAARDLVGWDPYIHHYNVNIPTIKKDKYWIGDFEGEFPDLYKRLKIIKE